MAGNSSKDSDNAMRTRVALPTAGATVSTPTLRYHHGPNHGHQPRTVTNLTHSTGNNERSFFSSLERDAHSTDEKEEGGDQKIPIITEATMEPA